MRAHRKLISDAGEQRSGALVLSGDPGIGKTALCTWAATQADGLRVLTVRGVETEVDLPFAGLSELLSAGEDSDIAAISITVDNARPSLGAALTVDANGWTQLTGTVDDPSREDDVAVTIDWNDGAPADTITLAEWNDDLYASHRFDSTDARAVTVTATDDDGGRVEETVEATGAARGPAARSSPTPPSPRPPTSRSRSRSRPTTRTANGSGSCSTRSRAHGTVALRPDLAPGLPAPALTYRPGSVLVRAERDGEGNGRVYRVSYEVEMTEAVGAQEWRGSPSHRANTSKRSNPRPGTTRSRDEPPKARVPRPRATAGHKDGEVLVRSAHDAGGPVTERS